MDKDRSPETKSPSNNQFRFEIKDSELGGESRAFGTSAFSKITSILHGRLKSDPGCQGNLEKLIENDVRVKKPGYRENTLAEDALGDWFKLCARKALTDYKAETGQVLEEGWGGSDYINLDSDAQDLETLIRMGSADNRKLAWKNQFAAIELEPKDSSGSKKKVILVSASLSTLAPLAACAVDPSPKPAIIAEAPAEVTEAIDQLGPTSTPFTQVEIPPVVTATETPEAIETTCAVDAIAELRQEGLQANYTVPVLTETGYVETLAEVNPFDVSTQVEFDLRRIIGSNPTNIKKLIIPEYINISLLTLDADIPFELVNYESGMDMAQEGTFLLSVHAGPDGWTTAIWEKSIVDFRSDLSARINGLLYEFTTTTDEAGNQIEILYQVPNQKDDNTQADIAKGICGPIVVRIETGTDWAVKALLKSTGVDISKNPEGIWEGYEEASEEETQPVSKLLNPEQVAAKTDAEIFEICGIPDYKEYSLSEELSAFKVIRNEGGSSYLLYVYANKDAVQLARNLETGVIEHAVYAEVEGRVPILILTDPAVVEKDGGWFGQNPNYADAEERLSIAINRALSFAWWAGLHPEDEDPDEGSVWLSELLGYSVGSRDTLTRQKKKQVSDSILDRFLKEVNLARENGSELNVNLNDKNRATLNAARETLVLRFSLTEGVGHNWQEIFDAITRKTANIRNVTSAESGSFLTLTYRQFTYVASRSEVRPVGGLITEFLRLLAFYYHRASSAGHDPTIELDITESIVEDLCDYSLFPDGLVDEQKSTMPTMDNYQLYSPTENVCAIGFNK